MPIDVAIIGVDGSGKSTCFRKVLKDLARANVVAGIGDEVYLGSVELGVRQASSIRWIGTKRWFRSTSKRVRSPLLYEITKLVELVCWSRIHREIKSCSSAEIILSDGAPLLNIAAWGVRYHPEFFNRFECQKALQYLSGRARIPAREALFYLRNMPEVLLLNWSGIAPFAVPHFVFFLHVSPDVAVDRIEKRGEELQTHETRDFLEALQNAYELVCDIVESHLEGKVYKISVDEVNSEEATARITNYIRDNLRRCAL